MTALRLAAAVLLAAVALSACGGDGEDEAGVGGGDFFGIAPQGELHDSDYARMAEGGVGSFHLLLSWRSVETEEGTYDWTRYDSIVANLARHGLEPLAYVFSTPPFYAAKPTDPPTESSGDLDAWARFLHVAAARYGPDGSFWEQFAQTDPDIDPKPVRVWEIWNEPNSSVFWSPRPDPDDYATLLLRSAQVLEDVDPDAQVMTGGMFATPQSDGAITSFDFLARLYEHEGVADAVDLIGVHPYGPTVEAVTEQVERTREAVDEAGEDADLWITELGWGSNPRTPSELAKSPAQQAELLTGSFEALLEKRDRWGLRGIIWFTWHDSPTPIEGCGWCSYAGLLDADRDPKPAWDAFTKLTGAAD